MLFPDVNVAVGAQRNDASPGARESRSWLDGALAGYEGVGVAELVLSAMVRIVTSPRVFSEASTPKQAVEFADALLAAPNVSVVRPGARHWSICTDLLTTHRLRGNDVPDAYLAAIALEVGATVITADRGFGRFGVRVIDPLTT